MVISLQRIKLAVTVALVAVFTTDGADALLRAATELVREEASSPRRDDSRSTTPVPSNRLTGVVRDDEGRPVAGATVVAGQFGGGKPNHQIGTTGPGGRFELNPAANAAHLDYVVVHKEGLAPASTLRSPSNARADEGSVVLQLCKPVPFVGVVRDRESKPVAGATARVRYAQYPGSEGQETRLNVIEPIVFGTPLERVFRTTTDAQGVFVFPDLPRDSKASLVVTAAGMGEYNTMNRRGPNGQFEYLVGTANTPAQLVLAPAARVVGHVVTRFPSIKVSGLHVAMQGSHDSHGIWAETKTDAEGRFEFTGLDEGKANIFLRDHPNDGPWTYRAAADTELRPGQTAEVAIELIRGVQVEGKVVDARDGNPVADVGVGVYGPTRPRSGAAIVSAKTDKEGRYRFRLPPGQTYFYICGPVPAEYGRGLNGGHTVEIPAGARDFSVPTIEIRPELLKP
jgi:5-hydroxyisourate hydrolase-like protein (transthyretin family)